MTKCFLKIKGHTNDIFSLRIGLDRKGKSILTGPQTSISLSKAGSLSIMSISFTSSVSESSIKWLGRPGSSNTESCIPILLIFREVLNGEGRLLERGLYFENLTFWRGAL